MTPEAARRRRREDDLTAAMVLELVRKIRTIQRYPLDGLSVCHEDWMGR